MSPFHSSLFQSSSGSHVNNVALLKFHVILSEVVHHLTTYKLDAQIDFIFQTCNQYQRLECISKYVNRSECKASYSQFQKQFL